jgi:transcriptional regulator with XRE-family HTH domain
MEITGEQIRAARALLRIEQDELARLARVSVTTVRRLEAVGGIGRVADATIADIRRALEGAGAEFIPDGVRRRGRPAADRTALLHDLRAIAEQSAALLAGRPLLSDADLYGDDGLPR